MSTHPVLKRAGDSFVVSTPDHEWIYRSFAQAQSVLKLVSRPDVEDVFACSWLVDGGYTEDGDAIIVECEAAAIGTARGFECAAGHSHVNASVRFDEGWDYVDSDEQAAIERGAWLPSFRPVSA
jgi:hypothetical protein